MKGTESGPLWDFYEGNNNCQNQEQEKGEEVERKGKEREGDFVVVAAEKEQCLILHKTELSRKELSWSWRKYASWRQKQNSRAARIEKQLKTRWELEELIEEQVNRFHTHYNHAVVPESVKDIAQFLMPKWAPPYELAALSWLGDWRPSAILDLIHGLANSSASSFSLSNPKSFEKLLSQLIHEIRIEEAIINEEMAEIQASCILHLPFSPVNNHRLGGAAFSCILAEFKKFERVFAKAQQLRFKALDLVVKKVLSHTEAAEFLVAIVGILNAIHQFAAKQKSTTGAVIVPVKALPPGLQPGYPGKCTLEPDLATQLCFRNVSGAS